MNEHLLHKLIRANQPILIEELIELYIKTIKKDYQRPNPFGPNPYAGIAAELKLYLQRLLIQQKLEQNNELKISMK